MCERVYEKERVCMECMRERYVCECGCVGDVRMRGIREGEREDVSEKMYERVWIND